MYNHSYFTHFKRRKPKNFNRYHPMELKFVIYGIIFVLSQSLFAQETQSSESKKDKKYKTLENVIITEQSILKQDKNLNQRAGSYLYLNPKELAKFTYPDIIRLLKGRSGVHLYEEEGNGLRPNISIRGSVAGRSQGINLMEDGILAAPAPYAASGAYYFPSIGRMAEVEILKGSGQILYGPNTVGGVLNLISTQVPEKLKLSLDLARGSFGTTILHVSAGDKIHKHFGYMVEYFRQSSNGFKYLPTANTSNAFNNVPQGDHTNGFTLQDFVGKFLIDYSNGKIKLGKLQFKIQYSDQHDQSSYVGTTREDFQKNRYMRYISTSIDKFQGKHIGYVLSYEIRPIKNLKLNIDGYYHDFKRILHRPNRVTKDGKRLNIRQIFENEKNKSAYIPILRGEGTDKDTIHMINNNRQYYSRGIQFNGQLDLENISSVIRFGVRYHTDGENRLHNYNYYTATPTTLHFLKSDKIGSEIDRKTSAHAFSAHIQYQILLLKKITITAGIRYENITISRNEYKKGSNNSFKRITAPTSSLENHVKGVFIPGISISYHPLEYLTVFGGIHRGFRPPGTVKGQKAETSVNYELGARYHGEYLKTEVIGYINNYQHMLGSALQAAGGGALNTDPENQGRARVAGLESQIEVNILKNNRHIQFPVSANYTYFYGQFTTGFKSSAFGNVAKHAYIPLIPKHQFRIDLSTNIVNKVNIGISGRYQTAVRTKPNTINPKNLSKEDINAIPHVLVFDSYLNIIPIERLKIYFVVQNLFNNHYIAATIPYGLRAGMPRFIKIGINVHL